MTNDFSSSEKKDKQLLIRLSSLGDVILASTTLSVGENKCDWVTSKEFAALLRGHPRIENLYVFDRHSSGLKEWVLLWIELSKKNYSEVIDLHNSLRTRIAQFVFLLRTKGKVRWRVISKNRWRLWGYFFFKSLWPRKWRPRSWVEKYSLFVGGTGLERPNLDHLLECGAILNVVPDPGMRVSEGRCDYYCVMPSSRWKGKKWPIEYYLEVMKHLPGLPVICGNNDDTECKMLCDCLERERRPYFSGVGKWDLVQIAKVLHRARFYIGNDTGLAHLAESLGTPSIVIYGPTSSDMGFGPWRDDSMSIERKLWCRPCSKDGFICYRPKRKYSCLKGLSPQTVISVIQEKMFN